MLKTVSLPSDLRCPISFDMLQEQAEKDPLYLIAAIPFNEKCQLHEVSKWHYFSAATLRDHMIRSTTNPVSRQQIHKIVYLKKKVLSEAIQNPLSTTSVEYSVVAVQKERYSIETKAQLDAFLELFEAVNASEVSSRRVLATLELLACGQIDKEAALEKAAVDFQSILETDKLYLGDCSRILQKLAELEASGLLTGKFLDLAIFPLSFQTYASQTPQEALKFLEEQFLKLPQNYPPHRLLCRLLLDLLEYEDLDEEVQRLLGTLEQKWPNDYFVHILRGLTQFDSTAAGQSLEKAVALEPHSAFAQVWATYYRLQRLALQEADTADATFNLVLQLTTLSSQSPIARLFCGLLTAAKGTPQDLELAKVLLRPCLNLPSSRYLFIEQGIPLCLGILHLGFSVPFSQVNGAEVDERQAIYYLNRQLTIEPSYDTCYLISSIYQKLAKKAREDITQRRQDIKNAIRYLEKAEELGCKSLDCYQELGSLYLDPLVECTSSRLPNGVVALEAYNRGIQALKNENNPGLYKLFLARAELYYRGAPGVERNHKAALEALEQVAEDQQGVPELLLLKAKIFFEGVDGVEKDFLMATKCLEGIPDDDSSAPWAWQLLEQLYHVGGHGIEKDPSKEAFYRSKVLQSGVADNEVSSTTR